MEASIPRKREASKPASEGGGTLSFVMFRGSTTSTTALSEASVAGGAGLGASSVIVAGFSG
eukprot:scaffold57305_cov50-Phaeocystis_antarctica.AAC.4